MPRPREFDADEVLDKAMGAFWRRGYEATSLMDLVEATGLKKGSIYQAFGDKHTLFLSALKNYTDQVYATFRTALEQDGPVRERLTHLFETVLVEFAAGDDQRRGCFTINTLVELGPHDTEARVLLVRQRKRLEKLLAAAIRRGQADGDFRDDIAAESLAATLNVVVSGVMADSKTGESKARTRTILRTALKATAR